MPELIKGEGPIPADGMIVGMNPGEQEEIEGKPFVGPSGQLLDEALLEAGTDRRRVYVTNVYKCRTPANREPSQTEIELHLDMLLEEIEAVGPRVIMLLGNTAMHTFFPSRKGITQERGTVLNKPGISFVFAYHPSYVLRKRGATREQFQFDVNLFARLISGK